MGARPEGQREVSPERRRHPRAETSPRYRRLRAQIDPPPALVESGARILEWLGRLQLRARLWRYRNRRAIS